MTVGLFFPVASANHDDDLAGDVLFRVREWTNQCDGLSTVEITFPVALANENGGLMASEITCRVRSSAIYNYDGLDPA